jgi:hypothetical protein
MFTFSKTDEPLFYIGEKPVYAQFEKDHKKRITPFRDSQNFLDSERFRERYTLTRTEAKVIKKAIRSDIVPESGQLKTKFYIIRKDLNCRLYSEIDLRGTKHTISYRFNADVKKWAGTKLVIGSSGSGKTHLVASWILRALKQKKKRKFVYVSPEFNVDTTLKTLRNSKRFQNWFTGIDVSDETFKESEKGSADAWWSEDIKPKLDHLPPGSVIILDDSKDSVIYRQTRAFMIKYMRTGRHKGVGLISIQHNVRGGKDTAQAYSSVKHVCLFPRAGGKGKISMFLHEMTGLPLRRAHEITELFAESGRWMMIHQFSPVCLFGEKYALFV